ncbi:hypothetical protein FRC07_006006 [Ceratobasidium sp. 392]|nr:hypothetical protein FRC07_006006 [Ceratobasidium sp. 392]
MPKEEKRVMYCKPQGIPLKEIRCNGRRFGVRSNGSGTQVFLDWDEQRLRFHVTLPDTDRPAFDECPVEYETIKWAMHADNEYNAVVLEIGPRKQKHLNGGWTHLLGDVAAGERDIYLVVVVDLSEPENDGAEDSGAVHEKPTAKMWVDFLKHLRKSPACRLVSRNALFKKLYPDNACLFRSSTSDRETFDRDSLMRLQSGKEWLNDELINVVISSLRAQHRGKNIMFLPTYCWRLMDPGRGKRAKRDELKKYYYGHQVFNSDVVLVPINRDDNHWILGAIFYPGNVGAMAQVDYQPNTSTAPEQRCTICLVDSLPHGPGYYDRCFRVIRDFLQIEYKAAHGGDVKVRAQDIGEGWIVNAVLPAPKQPNGHDCGVYMLHFMQTISDDSIRILNPGPTERNAGNFWGSESSGSWRNDLLTTLLKASDRWLEQFLL